MGNAMKKSLQAIIILVFAPFIAAAAEVSFMSPAGSIYSAGDSVAVTESVPDDIVAAGGTVIISGRAGDDVLAAGGTVMLSGETSGDARVAGGNLTLAGNIEGEAVVAGGRASLLPESVIRKGLIAACGEMTIEGTISGGARIIGGEVVINGTINQDVDIKAEKVIIGEHAVIKGNLHYEAPQEARIARGAVIEGQKTFIQKKIPPPGKKLLQVAGLLWVLKVMATIAAALAVYYLLRDKTLEITGLALDRFGNELLRGFIVLVVVPAGILLLFMTVIGWLLGMLGLFFYIAFVVLSTVLGALVFTRWSSGYLLKKEPAFSWPVILLGVLIYEVIGLIPFFGWIFKLVFFLTALGALAHLLNLRLRTDRAVP